MKKRDDDISLDVVLAILVAVIIGLAFILTHPADEARQVITITVPATPQPEKHCYLWNAQAQGLERVTCQ